MGKEAPEKKGGVTIDDIVYVIDSGRVKEKSYDAFTAVSTLQSTWISKANERQRASGPRRRTRARLRARHSARAWPGYSRNPTSPSATKATGRWIGCHSPQQKKHER